MRYDRLATFERFTPANELDDTGGTWATLFRDFISLKPVATQAQRTEYEDTNQVRATTKHVARLAWRENLTAADRFKLSKATIPNPEDLTADANYRFFNVEVVVNVNEANRELELLCTEVS